MALFKPVVMCGLWEHALECLRVNMVLRVVSSQQDIGQILMVKNLRVREEIT